jgi:hypothetical protein
MTRVGNNIKIVAPVSERSIWREVFGVRFGGKLHVVSETMDAYRLDDDGSTVGIEYVDRPLPSDAEREREGVWLEFVVADPLAMTAELLGLGLRRLEHAVGGHPYLQLPGGPVFRLVGTKQ